VRLWKIYYNAPEFIARPRLLGASEALGLIVEGFNNDSRQRIEPPENARFKFRLNNKQRKTGMGKQITSLNAKENRVIKLANKIDEVRQIDVFDRDEVGFASRVLVQCNLPHSDPGNDLRVWTRANGNSYLSIKPGEYMKNGKLVCMGYPYGNIPRLILFYLCTETIQTKKRIISLGDSLSEFMRDIGLEVTGGEHGTIHRFKEQLWRLLSSSISFIHDSEEIKALEHANIASKVQLWWDTKTIDQTNPSNSYIELSESFVNGVWAFPVPIDMGIIAAIKQSSLALDLYAWLTHRVTYLEKDTRISWLSIAGQVGSEYKNIKDFKKEAKYALKKICAVWPTLKIEEVRGGIKLLKPSTPSVPFKLLKPIT